MQRQIGLMLALVLVLIGAVVALGAYGQGVRGNQVSAAPRLATTQPSPAPSAFLSFQNTGAGFASGITSSPAFTTSLPLLFKHYRSCGQITKLEADYIAACQYLAPGQPAHGAINDIYGAPTWVVPSENAMAILGLVVASQVLHESTYLDRAQLAADYLIGVQDPADGAWYNQYSRTTPTDLNKSPRQTAEVMIALEKLGYTSGRYDAMKKGAQYLMECQKVTNKGGIDDGLLGGGKDAAGQYQSWRWTHDNAYAYWALQAASLWANKDDDLTFASQSASSAQRIIDGLNAYLYDPATGVWHIAVDAQGTPQWISHLDRMPSWIQYAPQMLDLPVQGANSTRIGDWIHRSFQKSDGSCIGYEWSDGQLKTRKYPGLAFQAALAWFDTSQDIYAEDAIQWAEASSLWQTGPDANGVSGGWIDWLELSPTEGKKADWWLRFIDTSFYAITACNGGYDFRVQ